MKLNNRSFEENCKEINRICLAAQTGAKEFVSERMAYMALIVVRSLCLLQRGDLLLYAAALNVLNTYVKQGSNKKSFGYFFKRNADVAAKALCKKKFPGVRAQLQSSWGMPYLLVDICGVQSSFHGVSLTDAVCRLSEGCEEPLVFDGVRKQMCAGSFFEAALQNSCERSNVCLFGKTLEQELGSLLPLYDAKKIPLSAIRSLHRGGAETTEAFIGRLCG